MMRQFRLLLLVQRSVSNCISTFSNVMGLPKREENKEMCMGDGHDLCQTKTTQWTHGRTEARQAHRIILQRMSTET